jgi:membrane protease YdiL (CAAX protease family)
MDSDAPGGRADDSPSPTVTDGSTEPNTAQSSDSPSAGDVDTASGPAGDVDTASDATAVDPGDDAAPAVDWSRRLRHLGEVLVVLLGAYLFAGVVVSALDPVVGEIAVVAAADNGLRLVQTAVQFLAIAAVSLWYANVVAVDRLVRRALPSGRSLALIAGGTVLLVAANVGINQGLSALGFESGENAAVTAGAGDPTYLLAMVVVSILLVGPAEELLFRGAIQGRLRQSWGPWPAILGATVLFGAIHAPAVSGTTGAVVGYLVTAAILGLLLGYLYERTDNIVVPAAIHGGNNAVVFGLLYLGEIGVL